MQLAGRRHELHMLTGMFEQSCRGAGQVVVLRGGLTCGKTALLHGFAEQVAATDATVLAATGTRVEQSQPLAMLDQMLQTASLDAEQSAQFADLLEIARRSVQPSGEVTTESIHDLGMALLKLAATRPLLLLIDDTEYADSASLYCLLFVALRIRSAHLMLALSRYDMPGQPFTFETELLRQPHCRQIALGPLSPEAVGELLAHRLGAPVSEDAVAAAHAASGGNPLLVHALADDWLDGQAGGGPAVHDAYRQAVVSCLYRREGDFVLVASAVAILGDLASAVSVGRLLDLDLPGVERAVSALTAAGLLDSYEFRHPAARDAVLRNLTVAGHGTLYVRAAAMLYSDGAPAQLVADLLVAAGTADGPWALSVLCQAAEQVLEGGSTEAAVEYLKLARLAAGDADDQIAVTALLSRAEWRLDPAAPLRHVGFLTSELRRGRFRGRHAFMPIRQLIWYGRFAEAREILQDIATAADDLDPETRTEFHSVQQWMSLSYPPFGPSGPLAAQPAAPGEHTGDPPESGPLTAVLGLRRGERAVVAAQQILQQERLDDATLGPKVAALVTLVYADRAEDADDCCTALVSEAQARGARTWEALFLGIRAEIALRQGDLPRAEASAREALSRLPVDRWGVAVGRPVGNLMLALTYRGAYQEVEDLLRLPMPNAMLNTGIGLQYLYARGQYYLAIGRPMAALGNFKTCGDLVTGWGIDQPVAVPWRTGASEAYLQLGALEQARELIDGQLRLLDASKKRARGLTLRLLAATEPPERRVEVLLDAVSSLEAARDQLELAKALTDLGSAYRAQQEVTPARRMLERAHHTARGCDAVPLVRRIEAELHELGKDRVPRPVPDPDGDRLLSHAELRVARLAADGHTNRKIAQRLAVSESTVEQHLTKVFRKLKIRRRGDLPKILAPGGDHGHDNEAPDNRRVPAEPV